MWPLRSQMASTQHRSSDHTLEGRFQGAIRDRASAFLGRNLLLYLYLAATSARTEHTFIEVSIASGHFSKPVLAEFSRGEASWSRLPRCCQARGCGAVRCGGAVEVRPCAAPAQLPRSAPALSSRTQLPLAQLAFSVGLRSAALGLRLGLRCLGLRRLFRRRRCLSRSCLRRLFLRRRCLRRRCLCRSCLRRLCLRRR